MEDVVEHCAGLDVHRDAVAATVRYPEAGRRSSTTRTFGTDTAELVALGDWLASLNVARVGLESTGVYRTPVFYLLEGRIPQVWLLNAQHLKDVPGRKTDVADSAWMAQLVEHGLVRPSFVPPPQIRQLRDFTQHRRMLSEERTRMVPRFGESPSGRGHQVDVGGLDSAVEVRSGDAGGHAGRTERSGAARRDGQRPGALEDPATSRCATRQLPSRSSRCISRPDPGLGRFPRPPAGRDQRAHRRVGDRLRINHRMRANHPGSGT